MKISKMQKRVLEKTGKAPMFPALPYMLVDLESRIGEFNFSSARPLGQPISTGRYTQWGYEGPQRADKGQRLGSCNRTACQRPGAFWYNRNMQSWYCTDCAHDLNCHPLPDGERLCVLDEEALEEFEGDDYEKRSARSLAKRYEA